MIRIICLLSLAALVSAAPNANPNANPNAKPYYDINKAPELFEKFIKDYHKVYKDAADRDIHYKAFVQALKNINKYNKENPSSTFDINHLSDLTKQELDQMNGFGNH